MISFGVHYCTHKSLKYANLSLIPTINPKPWT